MDESDEIELRPWILSPIYQYLLKVSLEILIKFYLAFEQKNGRGRQPILRELITEQYLGEHYRHSQGEL